MLNRQYKEIGKFALPCMAELMLFSMISVVNLVMVGRLGPSAISAVGLTAQPVQISLAVFQSFNIGATALTARYVGAGNYSKARDVIIQTLQAAVVLGSVISVPVYIFSESIVRSIGANSETLAGATLYMRFMAVGTIFQSVPLAVSSLLRGAGDSKNPMLINVIANIINLAAGYLLIFGKLGFPELGILGAGIAATLSKVIQTLIAVTLLFKTKLPVRLERRNVKLGFDWGILGKIFSIGSASAVEQVILRVGFFLYTRTIAELGTVAFAAHQVCLNISGLSTNFGNSLGMTSTSFTGRLLGARKSRDAMEYIKKLIKIALSISVLLIFIFLVFGKGIAGFYSGDSEVVKLLVPLMVILAVISPAQNSLLIFSGALKGAGETRWPLLTSLLGLIFIRLPLVFLFINHFHYGLFGAWIATAVEKYFGLFILGIAIKIGKWKERDIT